MSELQACESTLVFRVAPGHSAGYLLSKVLVVWPVCDMNSHE